MKAYRVIALPSVILLAILIGLIAYLHTPIVLLTKQQQQRCILVNPGENFTAFTQQLAQATHMPAPILLRWYGQLSGQSRQLKSGEYCFTNGATIADVLHRVTQMGTANQRTFTIISGTTFNQVRQNLQHSAGLRYELIHMTDKQLAFKLKLPHSIFEGEFLPDSYRYAYPESDMALLQRAHDLLIITLYQAWRQRAADLPYKSAYDALIAASIVEKESALPSDRRLIAGVIVNRLHKHMRLQMDPTVLYGKQQQAIDLGKPIASIPRQLTKADLRQDTPYNTYIHWGLPPTPICLPSRDAIDAVMHPIQSDYLYFVAREQGQGKHQFSRTLVEQRAAIDQYLRHDSLDKTE